MCVCVSRERVFTNALLGGGEKRASCLGRGGDTKKSVLVSFTPDSGHDCFAARDPFFFYPSTVRASSGQCIQCYRTVFECDQTEDNVFATTRYRCYGGDGGRPIGVGVGADTDHEDVWGRENAGAPGVAVVPGGDEPREIVQREQR